METIKLVCIDLDGTLLNATSAVSEENKEAVRACIRKGVLVYLVTGRPWCFTRYQADCISDEVKVICANGAYTEMSDGAMLRAIGREPLAKLIDRLKDTQACAFLKGKNSFYTHEPYDERFLYEHRKELHRPGEPMRTCTELSYDELKARALSDGILKILIYQDDAAALSAFRQQLEDIDGLHISAYQDISLDVTAAGVDKGSAIRAVCLDYGISRNEVMAIGDSENDIPMFEAAGLRVLMGNADESLRPYGNAVTGRNTEHGVAQALEEYVHLKS